jgi:hypothetical protein
MAWDRDRSGPVAMPVDIMVAAMTDELPTFMFEPDNNLCPVGFCRHASI